MSKKILESCSVSKEFKIEDCIINPLKEVNFTVNSEEIVSIVGESGAGKSTLLHILGGLDRPTGGKVLHNGEDIFKLSDANLAKFRAEEIGFIFQSDMLLKELTAIENVAIARMIAGKSKEESLDASSAMLKEVGLGARLGHIPSKLSGGESQRVAIARALVNHPMLVLCDEPTGNLDKRNSEEIFALIQRLNEGGQTFLIVTHNETIARQSDKVITITDGRANNGADS
ncbi:MAG: ABC transporter ATP-binding protein [Nitrospinota bacterium]